MPKDYSGLEDFDELNQQMEQRKLTE